MRLSYSAIANRIPNKEKCYFIFAVVTSVIVFLVWTPFSAPDFATYKNDAIKAHGGADQAGAVASAVAVAEGVVAERDTAEGDALRQRLEARMQTLGPGAISFNRNLFLRQDEDVLEMPPLTLGFPRIPAVPGFELPVGEAPATKWQDRAAPVDERPVKLLRDDGSNPFDRNKR